MVLKKNLAAAVLSLIGLSAAPAYAGLDVRIGIGVPVAPPAMVYEPVPPAPAVGYVWTPGYWGWNHDRYVWIRGRYVYGRPGYAWVPDRWEHHDERWHRVSGGWQRERHGNNGRGHARGHVRDRDR